LLIPKNRSNDVNNCVDNCLHHCFYQVQNFGRFNASGFIDLAGFLEVWKIFQIILFGFIISISSTAIVLEYLHKNNELSTPVGLLTTGMLLMWDFLIAPMLMLLNFMAERKKHPSPKLF
jgi:Kef-type K+ transport system membrane component KefB